jgi:hypothetical protein
MDHRSEYGSWFAVIPKPPSAFCNAGWRREDAVDDDDSS